MKFRTLSRINYFKRARHHGGHGIHSPFLFHLITAVIEDKLRYPEYETFRILNLSVLHIRSNHPGIRFFKINHPRRLSLTKSDTIYDEVDLPMSFGKLVFRLIREFQPATLIHFGPSLGINLAIMAIARTNDQVPIYQIADDTEYKLFNDELLKGSGISNITFLPVNSELPVYHPEFMVINYPDNPEKTENIMMQYRDNPGGNGVVIIRGIHQSLQMEVVWKKLIAHQSVRVSLDLFEIGIALFRKGLQKEDFIYRF